MAYPTSRPETLADGVVHLTGLLVLGPASIYLLMVAPVDTSVWSATALYVATLIFALAASALYHMLPFDGTRATLGRIDHASIYFKIAGTYTPLVVLIGSGFAYGVLGLVWALAFIGAFAKLWFWRTDSKGSLALYLGMGWLALLLIWPMWKHLPGATLGLVALGGVIYSLGTIFYAHPGMRYQNAVWHVFVLIASACLLGAIAIGVQAPGI
ncbi:PAQR family membrane homeostasis protein TrhA [Sulfitobacter aestuariivivens]|uniref:Hemolysin III family protein n=1 Tax=Sulfitobacter aestuariivivens TaxID=2766981 RepID=A0A927D2K7_9RHOB|nr:hemolysin III family protein [Sulfitobacter aestuariivivens]MBD3663960.1 hemolysin III family protein [Sulfitobacter aestuariivivens]